MLGCLGGEAVESWRRRRALVTWRGVRGSAGRSKKKEGARRGQEGTGGDRRGRLLGLSAGCAPFAALGLPFAPCPSFRLPEQAFQDPSSLSETARRRDGHGYSGGAQMRTTWAALPAAGCKNGEAEAESDGEVLCVHREHTILYCK